jgi:adenosylhomocysteine nucleosidase
MTIMIRIRRKKMKKVLSFVLVFAMLFSFTSTFATSVEKVSEVEINTGNVIGIIGAMEEEVEILKANMEIEKVVETAGMKFYAGSIHNQDVVVAKSGVGKVNAAMCAQLLITIFDVDYLVNSGVAGGMYKDLKQGDIVISTDAVQHDMDTTVFGDPLGEIPRLGITFFKADEQLIEISKKAAVAAKLEGVKVYTGRVASGDQFIAGGEKEKIIRDNFAPYAVEMEGAAIAHVAYLNDVPYVIIRAISDSADGEAELSYPEFLPIAAKNASMLMDEIIKISATDLPVVNVEAVVK